MSIWLWAGLIAAALLLAVSILMPDDWFDRLWYSDGNGDVAPKEEDWEMPRKDLQPQHDGGSSITQDAKQPSGSPGKPYVSGANVGSGKGPGPSKPAPASQPKGQEY